MSLQTIRHQQYQQPGQQQQQQQQQSESQIQTAHHHHPQHPQHRHPPHTHHVHSIQHRPLPPTPRSTQNPQARTAFSSINPNSSSNGILAINLVLNPEAPTGGEGKLAQCLLIILEICDFIRMCMEPFFRMLPLLGLLYVLVPYYNQMTEEYDEEEEEWNDEGFDYNALNLEK